ncbi:MAG: T9SS type A sorting domain-containing protein [Fluviicola sp.]
MRLLIAFTILSFAASAQIGTGQWRLHIPERAIDVTYLSGSAYVAYEKGVGVYDESSNELSIWDDVTGLSDITVSCIEACESDNSVFIGYENGNVDKLKGNRVTNIPAIKLAQIQGSKRVFNMIEYEEHMYLSTGFAIVKIDPKKDEVRDTYYPTNGTKAIVDVVFANDSIYALTEDEMYRGSVNNQALADPAQWTLDTRVTPASYPFSDIEFAFDELFVLSKNPDFSGDTVYQVTNAGLQTAIVESFVMEINSIGTVEDRLLVDYSGGGRVYNSNWTLYENLGLFNGAIANPMETWYDGNTYWIADRNNGLVKYVGPYQNTFIDLVGPPKSEMYALDYQRGTIAVCSGARSGGAPTFNRGGIYTFKDEEWRLLDQGNVTDWSDTIHDYMGVSINPNNENQIGVGTYSSVPVSIIGETGQVTNNFDPGNSELEATSIGNGWSLISDVQYDNEGNLWVLNGYAAEPLKVYTSNGQWLSFNLGPSAKSKITERLEIDYNGNKWMAIRGAGLYGFKDNGTVDNPSDDQWIQLNQGDLTGALPSTQVTAIAVDFDNEIWIGTDAGFAVLYNSDNAFDAAPGDYNAQRIKLEFEGNVEFVLGATHITDIEVDGGNRKWFGTANSGIILLSEDGLTILEQWTMDNSPLISNNIIDMEINQETGEMFIITDQGLISYRTDATYEDPEYSDVQVFPNPARPDFDGVITIQGIKFNSDVKITDAAGNLVYQTTSNGGTATWDRRTLTGELVRTGVYLIWTASNQNDGRYVGKVLVVNER